MPPRSKRNAISRRHHASTSSPYIDSPQQDLLSFDPDPPPQQTSYSSVIPAIFDSEPPPSDPEVGRASTAIRDSRHGSNLILDTFAKEMYGAGTSESDIDDGGPVSPSTSPPGPSSVRTGNFAVADLPVQGRSAVSKLTAAEDTTSDESSLSRSIGHTRAPVLARDPTTLESFSRTIRNYVPSSIPIPSAAPSPPRVSKPVSFGSFLTPSSQATPPPSRDRESEWKRRGSDASSSAESRGRYPGQRRSEPSAGLGAPGEMPVFSLDDDIPEDGPREDERRVTRYPGVGDTDEVLWAGWDTLTDATDGNGNHAKSRSVLMLGYPCGLQLWDCSNLGSVSELLNLTGSPWGAVEFAGVLPDPPTSADDAFRPKRPLIGFSSRTAHGTDFLVYSLRTHEVVKRLSLIGFKSFAASNQYIILCTSSPPTLHIVSACTLATLYITPSSSLVSFTPPQATATVKPNIHDVSSLDLDQHYQFSSSANPLPHPIYAHSNRLLAYVSPLTRHEDTSTTPGQAHTSLPITASETPTKFTLGMTQADLGNAAVKIGGSVLSGMKTLGGIAFSAARAGVTAAVSGEQGRAPVHTRSSSTTGSSSAAGALGMFFSKSAPAAPQAHEYQTAADKRRRSLRVSSPVDSGFDSQATVTPNSLPPPPTSPVSLTSGCNVIVVDLHPLLTGSGSQPEPIAQFTFSRPQAISALEFSPDGTSIAVCSKDGHAVRVFQIRPAPRSARQPLSTPLSTPLPSVVDPRVRSHAGDGKDRAPPRPQEVRRTSSTSGDPPEHLMDSMQHMYTLRRGRTSGVVERMEWAHDKMWFAMSTRKRTIHVFATNPLGGRPDGSSHLLGKVVNGTELISTSTELSPLVRVRLKAIQQDAVNIPCAFTFLRSSEATLPQSLLPPASVHFSASSSPSSVASSSGLSKPVSPAQRPTRPTNYKDMLVFDPNDGTLTLHRIFIERPSPDQAVIPGSIPIAGGMSISLPGMSTLSRMGTSPPSSGASPRATSGLTQMMERSTDIVGRDSVVGTWSLARGMDWPEVRPSLRSGRVPSARGGRIAKADWLSRAELSTFSTSHKILPRLVYLTHQFSFYALGEDYHALIRSNHFDIPSDKIEVRKPIEVSAFASSDSDAFVQGISSHEMGRVASSFDEPLASALSAQLHPLNPSPPVLPMLPNGMPGSASKSLINAIPIRQVAAGIQDGMSGGLGRIRRELGKARPSPRSPTSATRDSSESVATPSSIRFDEDDEDFFVQQEYRGEPVGGLLEADVLSRSTSTSTGPGVGLGIDVDLETMAGVGVVADSASGSGSGVSISTPSTNLEPLPVEDDGVQMWQPWDTQDQQAVEEAERFDDITVGFLDEQHETMRGTEVKKSIGKKKRRIRH